MECLSKSAALHDALASTGEPSKLSSVIFVFRPQLHFELTYLDLSATLDFFAVLSMLDRVRSIRHFCSGAPGTARKHVVSGETRSPSRTTATQVQATTIGFQNSTQKLTTKSCSPMQNSKSVAGSWSKQHTAHSDLSGC